MVMPPFDTIAFVASDTPEANEARAALVKRYGDASPEDADAIVALGGDGLMLQTMHNHLGSRIPIYGMNRGSVGFLLNDSGAAIPAVGATLALPLVIAIAIRTLEDERLEEQKDARPATTRASRLRR